MTTSIELVYTATTRLDRLKNIGPFIQLREGATAISYQRNTCSQVEAGIKPDLLNFGVSVVVGMLRSKVRPLKHGKTEV